MILIGIGVQAMVRAFTTYVLCRTSEHDVANTMRWMSGSLNNAHRGDSIQLVVVAALGGLILLCF